MSIDVSKYTHILNTPSFSMFEHPETFHRVVKTRGKKGEDVAEWIQAGLRSDPPVTIPALFLAELVAIVKGKLGWGDIAREPRTVRSGLDRLTNTLMNTTPPRRGQTIEVDLPPWPNEPRVGTGQVGTTNQVSDVLWVRADPPTTPPPRINAQDLITRLERIDEVRRQRAEPSSVIADDDIFSNRDRP